MDSLFEYPVELDTPEFREAWEEWKQHRIEMRKKMTPTGSRRLLVKLATWGEERAIAAIHYSLEQGWQGLFEPRDDQANGNGSGPAKAATSAAALAKAGFPTVGEAWKEIQEMIRRGLKYDCLSPITLEALRQFGPERMRLLKFDQMNGAFAQFRELYSDAVEKALALGAKPNLKVAQQ